MDLSPFKVPIWSPFVGPAPTPVFFPSQAFLRRGNSRLRGDFRRAKDLCDLIKEVLAGFKSLLYPTRGNWGYFTSLDSYPSIPGWVHLSISTER